VETQGDGYGRGTDRVNAGPMPFGAYLAIVRASGAVDFVCAHTRREESALTRVLARAECGARTVLVHPEYGPIRRWERSVGA